MVHGRYAGFISDRQVFAQPPFVSGCQVVLAQLTVAVVSLVPAGSLTGVCGLEAFCRCVIPLQPYMSSPGRRTADGRVF